MMMLYEVFKERVIAKYHPAADSPVGQKLREGDELEARRAAMQPAYTAAVERQLKIEEVVLKPRAVGRGLPPEWDENITEWHAARRATDKIARELSDLHREVQSVQAAIIDMLHPATVDAAARNVARQRVTGAS